MKKIKLLSIITLGFVLTSCGNSKETNENNNAQSENSDMIEHPSQNQVDFLAHEADSSWQLSVQFDGDLIFTHPEKEINFKGKIDNITVAQGADVLNIFASNKKEIVRLNIDIVSCNETGKRVNIMHRPVDKKNGDDFSGCGFYRGSPQLDDIWAVTHIDKEAINPAKFPKDIPHFEINLRTKQFSGFAGCNQVNGSLRFEYNKMYIEPLASTKKYCADLSEIENKILKILRNGPVIYTIKGTKLILETTKGYITLKKVD
ncbi:MAG: META domain-containing protein [Brumimicrobium sp.]